MNTANNKIPDKNMSILIVGSLPPPLGGTAVSLQAFIDSLNTRNDVSLQVVDTSKIRHSLFAALFRYLSVICKIFNKSRSVDILSLHISPTALPFIGPPVFFIASLFRKPICLRFFGGVYFYDTGPKYYRRYCDRLIRNADLVLLQTKALVDRANREAIHNVRWFPTNRPFKKNEFSQSKRQLREPLKLIYLGHVEHGKGVMDIISVAQKFNDDSVLIDIYGPLRRGFSEKNFDACQRVNYCGPVEPSEVIATLASYDALIFPSHYDSEGYPGVLIEALIAGIPVVASDVGGVSEIIDHGCGILYPPGNVDDLYAAILQLKNNHDYYNQLRNSARDRSSLFETDNWSDFFVRECRSIICLS